MFLLSELVSVLLIWGLLLLWLCSLFGYGLLLWYLSHRNWQAI